MLLMPGVWSGKKKKIPLYTLEVQGGQDEYSGGKQERFSFPRPGGKAQAIVHYQPRWKVSPLATRLGVKSRLTEKDPDAGKD